jgi:hypothetical protein
VTDLVRIFFLDAPERKLCEPLSSVDVEVVSSLSSHGVRGEKQESSAKGELHRAATLNEMSAGLKPL